MFLVWIEHEDQEFYSHIFNGCYAGLMFIVVVFFLIYGVEVFFKVRPKYMICIFFVLLGLHFFRAFDYQSIQYSARPATPLLLQVRGGFTVPKVTSVLSNGRTRTPIVKRQNSRPLMGDVLGAEDNRDRQIASTPKRANDKEEEAGDKLLVKQQVSR